MVAERRKVVLISYVEIIASMADNLVWNIRCHDCEIFDHRGTDNNE